MRTVRPSGWFVFAVACLLGSAAQASLRCGTGLIEVGDSMSQVLRQCGSPAMQDSAGPALRANGQPRLGAARISIWVYGPDGGGYQYLRFIDENLVEIRMRREPPRAPLVQ